MACTNNLFAGLINLYKKIYLFSLPVAIIVAIVFLALSSLLTYFSYIAYQVELSTNIIIQYVSFGIQICYYFVLLIIFRNTAYTNLYQLNPSEIKAPFNLLLFLCIVLMAFLNYFAYFDMKANFQTNLLPSLSSIIQPVFPTLLDHIPYLILGIITTYICNKVKEITTDTDLPYIERILVYYKSFREANKFSLLICTTYHTIVIILMAYNLIPVIKGVVLPDQKWMMIYQLSTTTLKSILGLLYICLSLEHCHNTVQGLGDILR